MIKNIRQNDISYEQFLKILPILESATKRTRPRKTNLYDIFCGILYLLKTGCQWREIPEKYPNWKLLHYYFTLWKNCGIFEQILQKLVSDTRKKSGRKSKTSFIIIDSQSVKNTDSAKKKAMMRAKKSLE
jgi:transposase